MKEIDSELLEQAKQMYMDYKPVTQIAKELGLVRVSLQYHVGASWRKERDLMKADLFSELTANKRGQLTEISGLTLDIITKALKDLASSGKPINMTQARMVSSIFSELDKVIKLDEGNPTDIVANTKPTTIIELKKKLKEIDPFEIEDAEIIEERQHEEIAFNVRELTAKSESDSKDSDEGSDKKSRD